MSGGQPNDDGVSVDKNNLMAVKWFSVYSNSPVSSR